MAFENVGKAKVTPLSFPGIFQKYAPPVSENKWHFAQSHMDSCADGR
jgi:hypothetical protein